MSKDVLISIIDNQESVREAIRSLVQSYGYQVATFKSAELFLRSEVLSETKCVVADLKMPGLTGLELHKELKARGHLMRIILMTAHQDEKQEADALDAGAVGYLIKPFDEEALIGCLTTAINDGK